ncbi:MAG: hypothetical protein WAM42_26115 [Candidatus Nitrosopolaris sp.]
MQILEEESANYDSSFDAQETWRAFAPDDNLLNVYTSTLDDSTVIETLSRNYGKVYQINPRSDRWGCEKAGIPAAQLS